MTPNTATQTTNHLAARFKVNSSQAAHTLRGFFFASFLPILDRFRAVR
jgi:hypothetical protein